MGSHRVRTDRPWRPCTAADRLAHRMHAARRRTDDQAVDEALGAAAVGQRADPCGREAQARPTRTAELRVQVGDPAGDLDGAGGRRHVDGVDGAALVGGRPAQHGATNAMSWYLIAMCDGLVPGRHVELCVRVDSDVRTVRPHLGSHSHGGVHVTIRHTTAVTPLIWVLHWPYRKTLQHVRRRSQSEAPAPARSGRPPVAVDVVARRAQAERRGVDLPPSRDVRVVGAGAGAAV